MESLTANQADHGTLRGRMRPNGTGLAHSFRSCCRIAGCAVMPAVLLVVVAGCRSERRRWAFHSPADSSAVGLQIEYPDLDACLDTETPETNAPLTIDQSVPPEFWDVTLEEAIQLALERSKVLADLGGSVLRSPTSVVTTYGPAIQETDPRFGVEAALSAFDAHFSTTAFFEKNDRALNNTFFGGGTRLLTQDTAVFQSEITKRTAWGSQLAIRGLIDYDANNAPGNAFPSAWNVNPEIEARVPLGQGAGAQFNQIAGPSRVPGVMNGVLIARTNSDISLAEFELALINYIANVENAYWDLYFAYRDLDAKIAARDGGLEMWRRIRALYETGRRGGEAEKEAQAREQYFRFEQEVQDALAGRLLNGTETNNGSRPGTFRGDLGVQVAERRLRLLIGLPISDGRMIRPLDEPVIAPVAFDWNAVTGQALALRAELRRQRWRVKQRHLMCQASQNFLKPSVDVVGRYRWRGFGDDLLDSYRGNKPPFDNAFNTLTGGDFQEWQLGVEWSAPIGYRRAHTGVRNAQLNLARERAVLREQERQIVHDLSGMIAEKDRAMAIVRTSFNRRIAACEQVAAVQAAYDADQAPLDLVLEAQRRLADSESRYHRARVEYTIAIRNVHFEKGTLLDYRQVYLSEGPWPYKAYRDAGQRKRLRGRPRYLDYRIARQSPLHPIASAQTLYKP
jgi:outer membrane protein TolC